MAEKHIRLLNGSPEKVPRFSLRRGGIVYQITPELDMASINHRPVWGYLLDEGNQAWHLRVIDHDDICTAFFGGYKGASLCEPVAFGIRHDPFG